MQVEEIPRMAWHLLKCTYRDHKTICWFFIVLQAICLLLLFHLPWWVAVIPAGIVILYIVIVTGGFAWLFGGLKRPE